MQPGHSRLSNSELLKAKIRLAGPRLDEQLDKVWNHSHAELVFKRHLVNLYYCVHASIPLLETARQRSAELASSCPVAAALEPYYKEHIAEEHNHDLWILEDVEVLGIKREHVLAGIPPTAVARLVGSVHYYITSVHPIAMMAYLAVVEGDPPRKEALDKLVATTNIPPEALRSLYKHGEIDIHHSEEIWSLLDSLPLSPGHVELLGLVGIMATENLALLMEVLLKSVADDIKTAN